MNIDGDLRVKGWDEQEVLARAPSAEDLTMEQRDDEVHISCRSECTLRVPRQSVLVIESAQGNTTFKALDGELTLESVQGNLSLRGVGPTRLNSLQGSLTAKNVSGDLTLNTVQGNATVRDIQGMFVVEDHVNGNLVIGDVDGDASASANGNINLSLDPAPGNKYDFEAEGNILCRLPEDASVEINITQAARILAKYPGGETTPTPQAPHTFTLGEGDSNMKLSAVGNVTLMSQAPDWDFMPDLDIELGEDFEGMAEAIQQQVATQMDMMEQHLDAQMEALSARLGSVRLSEEQTKRIEQRAREATSRAQRKMRQAQEKLERKMAAAQRKAERRARSAERRTRGYSHTWSFGLPSTPAKPAGDPVSDEERLMILRMLEQKKISPEEAEQLLAALESNER